MDRYLLSTLFLSLLLFSGLSAQNEVQKPTAFTYSVNTYFLQDLMEFSESNPNLKSLFLLEKQPEVENGQIVINKASGVHSVAYGNMTATELYAHIINVPVNQIYSVDDLGDQRYNLFYHFGDQEFTAENRQRVASLLLDELNIKVSQDSVAMDRMIITTNAAIESAFNNEIEPTSSSVHSSPFKILIQNHPLSKVLFEVRSRPLFQHFQIVDRTELSDDQTLNLDLSTESIDDFIATAAEQGLEIELESGKGIKVKLEPK